LDKGSQRDYILGVKQLISRLTLFVGLLALFVGCDNRERIFDFYANPVLPPLSRVESGTYDHVLNNVYLDKADNSDSRIYYTFDPDLSYTDLSRWGDYYATSQTGFTINVSRTMRTFSYASPTRFSEVKTLTWVLKCPQAAFNISPGAVNSYSPIYINAPYDTAFLVNYSYTTDGTDPRLIATPTSLAGGTSIYLTDLNMSAPLIRVYAVTSRPGWSDSNPVDVSFSLAYLSAGFTFTLNLPDGTTVGFTGQSPALNLSQSMTINATPAGMASYQWFLNGQIVCLNNDPTLPYTASSLQLGNYSPTPSPSVNSGANSLSSLSLGSYNLSCIALGANGYAYSRSISFSVIN
jgi:hypothetical protein